MYSRVKLLMATNDVRMNDDVLKWFYYKKISEGKHHYFVLNAIAAKLLRIVYSVLKNNKEYRLQTN